MTEGLESVEPMVRGLSDIAFTADCTGQLVTSLMPLNLLSSHHIHPCLQGHRKMSWSLLRPFLILLFLYVSSLMIVILLLRSLPGLGMLLPDASNQTDQEIGISSRGNFMETLFASLPRSIEDIRQMRQGLDSYVEAHSGKVLLILIVLSVILQTLTIPGAIAVDIIVSSIYPFSVALLFVEVISTLGACLNYGLVLWLLKDLGLALFPAKIAAFQLELRQHSTHLYYYLLFVRVTPIFPHWLVNMASAIVGVPFLTFLSATALGYLPMNVIVVQAGSKLANMTSLSELYSPCNLILLMIVGGLALVPVLLKQRSKHASGLSPSKTFILPVVVKPPQEF